MFSALQKETPHSVARSLPPLPRPRPRKPRLHCLSLWRGLFWTLRLHRVGFMTDSISIGLVTFCFPLLLPFFWINYFYSFLAFHFILSAEVLTISFVGLYFSNSVQFSSVTQSCPTLCDPMNRSTPGLPVHHQLPEFTQTHIHQVSDAIQPSHPLSSPSPPAPNRSQHQNLFQWVNSLHEVAKVLEFQL